MVLLDHVRLVGKKWDAKRIIFIAKLVLLFNVGYSRWMESLFLSIRFIVSLACYGSSDSAATTPVLLPVLEPQDYLTLFRFCLPHPANLTFLQLLAPLCLCLPNLLFHHGTSSCG